MKTGYFLYLKQFITYCSWHVNEQNTSINLYVFTCVHGIYILFLTFSPKILHLNNLILNIYLIVNDFVTISLKNIVKQLSYSLVLIKQPDSVHIYQVKNLNIKGGKNVLICVKILTSSNYWLLLQCNRWTIYNIYTGIYKCTCCTCIWSVIKTYLIFSIT